VRWCWQFRILAARAQIFRGQYKDAIGLLTPPLPSELTNDETAVLRKMTLANAEDLDEQFGAAEVDLAESERLAAASSPQVLMQVTQSRANLEYDRKKYPGAEAAFRKVLKISRELRSEPTEEEALGGLGNTAMEEDRYDEAADWYKESLELARKAGTSFSVPTTLGNLGWSYDALGDYENAKEFYEQAEQACLHAGQKADRIAWLTYLSDAYFETHDYLRAESIAAEALKLARQLGDPHTTVQSLNALAEVALETNRWPSAEKYNREAASIEIGDFDHREIVNTELDAGRIAELSGQLQEAERLFTKVRQDPAANAPWRWEADARLANVYRGERRSADAEREFRLSLKTIEDSRTAVHREESRLSFLSGAITFYGAYIDFLISEGRTLEALQIAETSRARILAEGLAPSGRRSADAFATVGLQGLAKRLNSILLCYWMGREHSHLWVISADKTTYFPLAGSEEIDSAVKSYREALLASRDALHPVNRDGAKLYTMLVEPAQALIAKDARVTILPDASLYALNFETLIVPGMAPHYWIEDASVTTASSLTMLAASVARRPPTAKNLLLIGNTEEASNEFPRLPQASAEMRTVEHYFAKADRQVLEGKQATPAAYLSDRPERFAYLHFVTHGTASLTKPMESAVILSPGADTYKLYARDIVAHHLNANLVTISACNGAGTRAYSGEGLVGLSWAFLRAGAHNVIGALWEVSDSSTPQLMDALYGGLSQGKPPATALRDAKLSLLHSGTVYSKPYYWAPFQLYAGS
jgi:CHAT domain-containing protein